MKVIIDNGHGKETKGKRSPDERIREYAYARKVKKELINRLKAEGIEAVDLVPEENDIPLSERCRRANRVEGNDNFLISIHLDAAGNSSQWMNARGFSVRVSKNASSKSKKLAQCLYDAAASRGLKGNRCVPPERYWVQNLAICRDTRCPAALTENLFQDNKQDVDFLLSDEGFKAIVDLHVEGIKNYINFIKAQ